MDFHARSHKKTSYNKYQFIFELGRDTGKRKRVYKTFNGGSREAKSEFNKLLAEYEKGTILATGRLTLKDYLNNWLKTYVEPNLAPKTYDRYKGIIELRVIPKIGNVQLDKLRPLHLKNFLAEVVKEGRLDGKMGSNGVLKPLSHDSIAYHHRVLHKALACAVKDQLIAINPADAVEVPKPAQVIDDAADKKENVKVLDPEQLDKMLKAASDH